MPPVIRAALFDFGGVIVDGPFEAFAAYERDHELPEGLIRRINATDPDTNAWARLERSEVDADGFAELFEAEARALGHPIDGHQVLGLLSGSVTVDGAVTMGRLRPAMVEAVRRCSQHLVTGLLTNNFVPADARASVAGTPRRQPARRGRPGPGGAYGEVLGLFDGVIESAGWGCASPIPGSTRSPAPCSRSNPPRRCSSTTWAST